MELNYYIITTGENIMLKRIDGSVLYDLNDFNSSEIKLFLDIAKIIGMSNSGQTTLYLEDLNIDIAKSKLVRFIKKFCRKISAINCVSITNKKESIFFLFSNITLDLNEMSLDIQSNPNYHHILQEIYSNWTVDDLVINNSLKTEYAKSFYTLFRFYHDGNFTISVEHLKDYLFIDPNSVYQETNKLMYKVIKPSLAALEPYFENIKIDTIKKGKFITHFIISYDKKRASD